MIFLSVDKAEADRRMAARTGHFVPEQLLASQFAALEPPQPGEPGVTVVASDKLDPEETVAAIIAIMPPGEGASEGTEP